MINKNTLPFIRESEEGTLLCFLSARRLQTTKTCYCILNNIFASLGSTIYSAPRLNNSYIQQPVNTFLKNLSGCHIKFMKQVDEILRQSSVEIKVI